MRAVDGDASPHAIPIRSLNWAAKIKAISVAREEREGERIITND